MTVIKVLQQRSGFLTALKLVLLVVSIFGCILSLALVSLLLSDSQNRTIGGEKQTPPSAIGLPVYPGARNINERSDLTADPRSEKVIVFDTTDSSDTVQAFYRKLLLKEGWESITWSDKPANVEKYVWSNGLTYSIRVTTTEEAADITHVELRTFTSQGL